MEIIWALLVIAGLSTIFGYGEGGEIKRRDVVGCQSGWRQLHKHCYFVSKSKETFSVAEQRCREENGHLTSLNSPLELDYVANITFVQLSSVWVGYHLTEGGPSWTDNSTLDFQPDGFPFLTAERACTVLTDSVKTYARLGAANCSQYLPFVCKKSADSRCRDEDIEWLNVKGRSFPKHNIKKIDGVENMGKCKRICLKQSEFSCLSVNYLRAKKYCILSSDTMQSTGVDLIRSRQFTYAEWSCGDQSDRVKALETMRVANDANDNVRDQEETPSAAEPAQLRQAQQTICPDDYHLMAGECIKPSFKAMTFEDAKNYCEKEGGRMSNVLRMKGIPDIGDLYRDLDRKLRKSSLTEHAFWLGASWTKSGGLNWADPYEELKPNWSRGQPSSKFACLIVTEKETWDTRPCSSRYTFVCKKDASTVTDDVEYFTLKKLFTRLANMTHQKLPICRGDINQRRFHRYTLAPSEGYLQNYRSRTVQCKRIYTQYRENSIMLASIGARLWKHRNDSEPIPIITPPSRGKSNSRYRRQAWQLLKPDVYYRQTGIPLPCHHLLNKTILHGLGWRNVRTLNYVWSKTFTPRTFSQLMCLDEVILRKIFLSANDLTIEELKVLPSTAYRLLSPTYYRELDRQHKWAYCAGLLLSKPTSHDVKYALEDKNCRDVLSYSNMSGFIPTSVTSNGFIMSMFCANNWKEVNGASCRLLDIEAYEYCFKIGGIRYYDLRPKCVSRQYTAILMDRVKAIITAQGQHDRLQVYAAQLLLVHGFVTSPALFCPILDNIDDLRVRRGVLQLPQAQEWIFECYIPSNLRGSCSGNVNGLDDPRVQRMAIKGLSRIDKATDNRVTRTILALCAQVECPDDIMDKLDPALVFANMDACRPTGCWTDPAVGAKVAGILRMVRAFIEHRPLTVHDLMKLKCVLPGLGRHFLFEQKREQVVTFAIMALQHTPLDRRTANQLARVVISREQHRLMTKKPSRNALNQIYDYFRPLRRLLPYVDPDLVDEMDPDVCRKFLPDLAQCTDTCDSIRPQWFLAWKERAMAERGWSLNECHNVIQSCNGGRFLAPEDIYECAEKFPATIHHIENKKFLNRHMCYAVLSVQSERWPTPLEQWPAREIRQKLGRLIIGLHPDNITMILDSAVERDLAKDEAEVVEEYAEWRQRYRGKKDLRKLGKGRKKIRRKRLAAEVIKAEEEIEIDGGAETALDYVLLFASYFPQLRSTQRYAVMKALNVLVQNLPEDMDENAFRMIRKIILNDDTGNLIRSMLMTSRDKQETIRKICQGVKIPYQDKTFLSDIVSLYKTAVGTNMLDDDDILALDQCAFGLNKNDIRSLTDSGILEMCSSGVHYYDWSDELMALLARRTLRALHVRQVKDIKMEAFRNCTSVVALLPGSDVREISNVKIRCQAFSVIKRSYWLRRATISTRIERGEIRMSVSPGNSMYWYKKWEPIRKMWNGHFQEGWAAANNACSRIKTEQKRKKRRNDRRKRFRRGGIHHGAVPETHVAHYHKKAGPRCAELKKLEDAVVEQDKELFSNMSKHEFMDCLDFFGSREGYPKATKEHLATLTKKHGGPPSTWDSLFLRELGCIAQGLSQTDLLQLSFKDSLALESLGDVDGWSEDQLFAVQQAYLQDLGKTPHGLTGGDLMIMKNFVCGIVTDNILTVNITAYMQAAQTIGELSSCSLDQQRAWANLARRAFGDVRKWPREVVWRVGSVIGGLKKMEIESLNSDQIDAISPTTISKISPIVFDTFTKHQLSSFARDQVRHVSGEQLEFLPREKRYAVLKIKMKTETHVKEKEAPKVFTIERTQSGASKLQFGLGQILLTVWLLFLSIT